MIFLGSLTYNVYNRDKDSGSADSVELQTNENYCISDIDFLPLSLDWIYS